MISKGDLVRMRLSVRGDSGGGGLTDLFILGKVMNYCDDEETYILDPMAISIPKKQVEEIETLAEDFDFNDVSMELRVSKEERKREKPPEVDRIRFSRDR
jgi:hypothetical protein